MNEEHLNLMNQTLPTAEELIAEWKEFYKPETSPNEVNSNEVSREWEYPEDHNLRRNNSAKESSQDSSQVSNRNS